MHQIPLSTIGQKRGMEAINILASLQRFHECNPVLHWWVTCLCSPGLRTVLAVLPCSIKSGDWCCRLFEPSRADPGPAPIMCPVSHIFTATASVCRPGTRGRSPSEPPQPSESCSFKQAPKRCLLGHKRLASPSVWV